MDYHQSAEELAQKIWSYNQDVSGWTVAKNSVRIPCYVQWQYKFRGMSQCHGSLPVNTEENCKFFRYRAEGIVEDTPDNIIPFMYLPEYRIRWDKALKSYTLLERIDENTAICHTVTHSYGMGLISSRDFVDLIRVKRYEEGIITTNSVSVDYAQCPPSPAHIRGHNNPCGYVCTPLPKSPGHSKLVVFIQPDLGGILPQSIVESALPNNLINLINDTRTGIKTLS
ncbi:stAR-related lipid transfer protein 6 isoform X2 [Lepisosteus oculatus]|uniref:stAR-related lipid transfer protein 6 isoform X2 n=1 Tax=Lepisosteus oculatus TaxID=7918 RepID=UPI00073FC1EB|nr:PREDICTED: stAR-related lipid transfer protein 6 isoform X2 [Lepisosteus oculatus]XP_015217222.1 PREDICTED: stAR-related lipid transfer protein 6 isoform X2 [Lepisosteus oculatus]XP_015217229.1 PREDICTED: stAR-related lipid transfer protein 6 isoform X2 [Lepisosteus oculatus]